jgi:hypothetical protein
MRRALLLRLVAGLVATGALGACTAGYEQSAAGVVYVTDSPPVDRVEVIPASPGFNFVWVGGRWGWYNNGYSWIPGRWVVPAAGYRTWTPGRWDRDGHGWYYRDGHWR